MLENGAAVEQADLHGTTPLAIAKRNGHTAIVELIEDHMYPLHAAARTGDVDALERLLAAREAPAESAGEESSDDGRDDCRLKIDECFTGQSDDNGWVARGKAGSISSAGYKAGAIRPRATIRDVARPGLGKSKGETTFDAGKGQSLGTCVDYC